MRWSVCVALLLLLASSSLPGALGSGGEPLILSSGRLLRIPVEQTLILPCEVSHLDTMVLLWKKGNRVLTAGNMLVRRDPRIALKGTNLQITGVNIHDGGEYSCLIETDENNPLTVVHTVEILVPPKIMPEPINRQVTIRNGTTVTLECKANGNPAPTVSWLKIHHRKRKKIPEKYLSNNGMLLTLHNVHRRDAGKYQCTATNGVGQNAVEKISVKVLYKPDIQVLESVVQGGEGRSVRLSCVIHADPPATVTWYKNTLLLDNSHRYQLLSQGEHYYIMIGSVGIEDFANYTCLATNSMGKREGNIELRGNPERPEIDPVVRPVGHDTWRLKWITKSFANVTQYRLLYRKVKNAPHHSPQNRVYNVDSDATYSWTNVVFPHSISSRTLGYEQLHSYDIQGLAPHATYEAQIQAKNKFGWSEISSPLKFRTSSRMETKRPSYDDEDEATRYSTNASNDVYQGHTKADFHNTKSTRSKSPKTNASAQEYGISGASLIVSSGPPLGYLTFSCILHQVLFG